MNTLKTDGKPPLKGSPEYRRRYWRLVAVRILVSIVLVIGLLFGILGQDDLLSVLGWVAVGTSLIVAIMTEFELHALVAKGKGE